MIRSELVEKIAAENPHLFQRDIERIIGTVFDEIIDAMSNGNRVELRGLVLFLLNREKPVEVETREQVKLLMLKKNMSPFLRLVSFYVTV